MPYGGHIVTSPLRSQLVATNKVPPKSINTANKVNSVATPPMTRQQNKQQRPSPSIKTPHKVTAAATPPTTRQQLDFSGPHQVQTPTTASSTVSTQNNSPSVCDAALQQSAVRTSSEPTPQTDAAAIQSSDSQAIGFTGIGSWHSLPLNSSQPSTSSAQAQPEETSITLTLNSTTASSTASSTATTSTSLENANTSAPDSTPATLVVSPDSHASVSLANASLVSSSSSSASVSQPASTPTLLAPEPPQPRELPLTLLEAQVQVPNRRPQPNGPSTASWIRVDYTRTDSPDPPNLAWYKRLLNIYLLIFFPVVDAVSRALTLDLPNGRLSPEGLATMKQEGGWVKGLIKHNDNLWNEVKTGKDISRKVYTRSSPQDPYLIEGHNLKTRDGIDDYMAAHSKNVKTPTPDEDYLIIEDAGVVLYRDSKKKIYTKISFCRPNGSIWKKHEIGDFFSKRYLPNKEAIRAKLTGDDDILYIDREKNRVGIWKSADTDYGKPIVLEDERFLNDDAFTRLFFMSIKPRKESRRASEPAASVARPAAAPASGPSLVTPTQPRIETDGTSEGSFNNLNVVSS